MQISELNSLDAAGFVDALGWIFEDSPWVAARAWLHRPFSSVEGLHNAMKSEVEWASEAEKLALLRSHPDLGAREHIGDASTSEQVGAGLVSLSLAEFKQFERLNSEYRAKFGFPFVLAVKESQKTQIMRSLEHRLNQARDVEYSEALRQVYRIAEFRLRDVVNQK